MVVKDSNTGLLSIAYDHLIGPVIEAIKTLNLRLQSLEEKSDGKSRTLASLIQENEALKTRLLKAEDTLHQSYTIKKYLCNKDPLAVFCK